ncbi:MAG: asparagine synthase (glutamine-hydrolyzing) [Pirellulaceae bacterium]
MCGIAGILNFEPSRTASVEVLQRMLLSIFHRGPDEDGTLIDGNLAMGMRRLSIIDLADGKQPIFDDSGRYAVVFNGEIYNYRELRQTLIADGHKLVTHSDTETIVHLYRRYGERCLDHLRGMFAFAVWDQQERELFIARDRIGIKPLYYTLRDDALIFGSEIKALLQHPSVKAEPDHRAISEYLSLKYVPAPRTMFAEIQALPAGHSMRVRNGEVRIQRYWDLPTEAKVASISEDEALHRLGELLRESVRLRLRADVAFGAFLSGGVDSSVIVALMSEVMSEPVKTFSVGFAGGEEQDELPFAQQVADRFGCEHHTLRIGASDFLEHAEKVLFHLDQPIADQATVATHMVAKLARQHVKMVLTGEGGDELFAGYARYAGERLSPLFRPCPAWLGGFMRSASRSMPGMRRAKIALSALTIKDEATRMANWFPMFTDDRKQALLADAMSDVRAGAGDAFAHHLKSCKSEDALSRMLYVDSKMWLVDYLLLRGDKLTMANSLEARVPLLDHKLVEFAASLPSGMKLRGKTRKYLLKRLGSTLLPDSIIHRKKQGFPIPIEKWLRSEAKPLVRDLLSPDAVRGRGLFREEYVSRMIQVHESGYADYSTEIWGLVSLEMWMRRFIDRPLDPPTVSAPVHAEA